MVPRPKWPRRKDKGDASEAETKEAKEAKKSKGSRLAAAKIAGPKPASAKASEKPADKPADKPAAKSAAKPAAAAVAAKKPPAPNVQERIEGLQGWMAEIERKQGRMTYFGAAGLLVAILAAGAAIYLGITNQQDSADKKDFEALEERVTQIGDSLKSSTEEQLKTLNSNLGSIEQRLDAIEQKQQQTDTTIKSLQTQIDQVRTAANNQAAQDTTTTPTPAPGARP